MDSLDYFEEQSGGEGVWPQDYSSLEAYTDKVLEVMHNQATRGQVLRLSEKEAEEMFPNLTVASLGAQRKEKAGGAVTARVLFDGNHGIAVNHRTRIRDQERGPIAVDIKRIIGEKSKVKRSNFRTNCRCNRGTPSGSDFTPRLAPIGLPSTAGR